MLEGNTKGAILVVTYGRWHTTTYIGVVRKAIHMDINQLHDKFSRISFPVGAAGQEIEGVDLVLLDLYTAGCFSRFFRRTKEKDINIKDELAGLVEDQKKVIESSTGEIKSYFILLNDISIGIIESYE